MIRRRLKGYTRIERRRDRRRALLLAAELEGAAVEVLDVSLGGMRIGCAGVPGSIMRRLNTDDIVQLVLRAGDEPALRFGVRLTRHYRLARAIGVRFDGLPPAHYRLVERLVTGRWRARVAEVTA